MVGSKKAESPLTKGVEAPLVSGGLGGVGGTEKPLRRPNT